MCRQRLGSWRSCKSCESWTGLYLFCILMCQITVMVLCHLFHTLLKKMQSKLSMPINKECHHQQYNLSKHLVCYHSKRTSRAREAALLLPWCNLGHPDQSLCGNELTVVPAENGHMENLLLFGAMQALCTLTGVFLLLKHIKSQQTHTVLLILLNAGGCIATTSPTYQKRLAIYTSCVSYGWIGTS